MFKKGNFVIHSPDINFILLETNTQTHLDMHRWVTSKETVIYPLIPYAYLQLLQKQYIEPQEGN